MVMLSPFVALRVNSAMHLAVSLPNETDPSRRLRVTGWGDKSAPTIVSGTIVLLRQRRGQCRIAAGSQVLLLLDRWKTFDPRRAESRRRSSPAGARRRGDPWLAMPVRLPARPCTAAQKGRGARCEERAGSPRWYSGIAPASRAGHRRWYRRGQPLY